MEDTVTAAKAEFTRAKDRISKALASTSDDKINWAPSPTARTPIHQVVHAAHVVGFFQDILAGKPMPMSDAGEMDANFRKAEVGFTTREQANEVLEVKSAAYLAWLDTLTPEQIASTAHTGFGDFPMANAITFPADHVRNHAAQIDYTQTIYGDLDWHF